MTHSQEEYLKSIYVLYKSNNKIRITDIAKKLNVSKPSVNKAVKSLSDFGLINYEIYSDITFTDKGIKIAKEIIKKYDIVKLFLVEVIGVDEQLAEEEAKNIKTDISKNTLSKLEDHVTKILNLGDLDCDYDENSEKCRNCAKVTLFESLKNNKRNKKLI